MTIKRLWIAGLAVLATACANDPAALSVVDPSQFSGAERSLIVATSRTRIDDAELRYGAGRSDEMSFDDVTVWVPADRERGSLPYPKKRSDPNKEFGVTRIDSIAREGLISEINQRLAKREEADKLIFLYVHGYNNPYSHGVYRHAQIYHDFDVEGVPVHYSWPSAGRFVQYMYDRDSAQFARDGLVELLTMLSATEANSILVMAHSMGTLLAMEAVRQLNFIGADDVISRISPLLLASPDIDVDVFRTQMTALSVKPEPIAVFASTQDRALRFSQRLRGGHPRIGSAGNIDELEDLGVVVVDLSRIDDGDRSHHATFASSPTLIRMLDEARLTAETLQGADQDETQEAPLGRDSDPITDLFRLSEELTRLPGEIVKDD